MGLGTLSFHTSSQVIAKMRMERNKESTWCDCCLEEDHIPCIESVEEILDYRFYNRRLVIEAITHHSFHFPTEECISYERLEFIGDAVLNCLMAKELFSSYPELAPGFLTRLRAANVDTEKLARAAVKHNLHRYIRHKAPLLQQQIEEFMEGILEFPIHSYGLVRAPKVLADTVEALLGAVFVDSCYSFDVVWKVLRSLLEPLINPSMLKKHPVSELNELCQKKALKVAFRSSISEDDYNVSVFIQDNMICSANGYKKQIAQNRAAKAALDKLKKQWVDGDMENDSSSKSIAALAL